MRAGLCKHEGVPPTQWAGDYVGLPFLDKGRTREGIDCYGLARLVFWECLGVVLPEFAEISAFDARLVARTIIEQSELPEWVHVMPGAESEFDLAVMRGPIFSDDGRVFGAPRHVGIITGDRRLLHIERGIDAVCVPLSSQSVKNRIMKVYRHYA